MDRGGMSVFSFVVDGRAGEVRMLPLQAQISDMLKPIVMVIRAISRSGYFISPRIVLASTMVRLCDSL